MTEEAQPPPADRTAERRPEAPTDDQPRYLEPSYGLPAEHPGQSTDQAGQSAGRAGQAAWPVSEWARPVSGSPSDGPDGLSSASAADAAPGPEPIAAPVPAPFPAPAPTPYAGAPYAPADAPSAAGGRYFPAGGGPVPAYPSAGPAQGGPRPAGGGQPRPVPAPPRGSWRTPRRIEAVPGTPFGVVHLDVPPVTSGPAVGALITGIASVLVALAVGCFGIVGADAGWGGWTAGAFAVLAGLLGIAGVVLGELGRRQTSRPVRPPAVRFTGRGLAVAGISCGAVGLGLTVLAFSVAVLLQAA